MALDQSALGQVVTAVQQYLDTGTLVTVSADGLARRCWATAHGLAALEVAGLLVADDLEAFVETALRVPVDAARPPGS